MTDTHPPVAHRVVAIDFDRTIRPWGGLFAVDDPFPGVPEGMEALKLLGFKVVIHTSRLSRHWWQADHEAHGFPSSEEFGLANIEYVREFFAKHRIPYDVITAEKLPAEAYFDDKAIRVEPGDLPIRIRDFIIERGGA